MSSHSVLLVLTHIQAWEDPCGTLSHFQVSRNRCRKVKEIENWTVCNFLKWKRTGFSPSRKTFMNSLKRKLIELFKENLQLRQDYLKRRLNWTGKSGEGAVLILLSMKLADSSNPRGLELYQANQLSDQTQREKSWPSKELQMRNKAFSARSCKVLPRN